MRERNAKALEELKLLITRMVIQASKIATPPQQKVPTVVGNGILGVLGIVVHAIIQG